MKTFLISVVAVGLFAYVASFVLNSTYQRPSYEAYTTTGARVGDPGENLIGGDWPEIVAEQTEAQPS